MQHTPIEWVTFGKQRARTDGDTVIVLFTGMVTLAEYEQIFVLANQVIAKHGYMYFIGDVEHADGLMADARREFAKWSKANPMHGFANIKAKPIIRVLGTLIQNALRIVTGRHYPNTYVDDEAAARRWIAEQKQQRLAEGLMPRGR